MLANTRISGPVSMRLSSKLIFSMDTDTNVYGLFVNCKDLFIYFIFLNYGLHIFLLVELADICC